MSISHAAKIDALAAELITTLLQPSQNSRMSQTSEANTSLPKAQQNPNQHQRTRDAGLRNIKSQKFARTNPFNVDSTFEGLVEKLEVNNKDDVAEALGQRLAELKHLNNKWTPEYLSLLLHLSNQPVIYSRLEDLGQLHKPQEVIKELTWDDILADDPYSDEEVWRDIDFADSSDSEVYLQDGEKDQVERPTRQSTEPSEDVTSTFDLQSLIIHPDEDLLDQFRPKLNTPRRIGQRNGTDEVLVIREMLNVARGLPSSLLGFLSEHGGTKLKVLNTSESATSDLINGIRDVGACVNSLAAFCLQSHPSRVMQTFVTFIEGLVREYMQQIGEYEQALLDVRGPTIVSMMRTNSDVTQASHVLRSFRSLIDKISNMAASDHHLLLDDLYDQACDAEAIGNQSLVDISLRGFESCLNTYLRPVRSWMLNGALDEDLFIETSKDAMDVPAYFWERRYILHADKAPKILAPHLQDILAAGKSVALSKALSADTTSFSTLSASTAASLDQSSPSSVSTSNMTLNIPTILSDPSSTYPSMLPFSITFPTLLSNHLSTYHSTSTNLTHNLLHNEPTSLLRTLTALQTLYLSTTSSLSTQFATSLFDLIDTGATWTDRFTLEDLASSSFGIHPAVNEKLIFAGSSGVPSSSTTTGSSSMKTKTSTHSSVKNLAGIAFLYKFHWSVANIIPLAAVEVYQSVFTILLQLKRSFSLVCGIKIGGRSSGFMSRTRTRRRQEDHEDHQDEENSSEMKVLMLSIRHRLLHTLLTIEDHLMNVSIAPCITRLEKDLAQATNVEDLISAHKTFITDLERKALLMRRTKVAKTALVSLFDLGVVFASRLLESVMSVDEEDGQGVRKDTRGTFQEQCGKLEQMKKQLHSLLDMIKADLMSACREGGDGWEWAEQLADRL